MFFLRRNGLKRGENNLLENINDFMRREGIKGTNVLSFYRINGFRPNEKRLFEQPVFVPGSTNNAQPAKNDKAMVYGGIDLTQADSGITVNKDAQGGVTVNLNPALIARIRKQGIQSAVPVIVDLHRITMTDIKLLL